MAIGIVIGVLLTLGVILLFSLQSSIFNCAPNEVLVFTGGRRRVGNRAYGYRLIKGGMGFRVPMFERVDRMDLTNMIIEVSASNAYSKGGIPLSVQGVANVKIAGHEPLLNNAIERFLGRKREDIALIAKATLEGSLRGVLASLTPEQVNEDMILFAERLVQEVEQDMQALGLVVDTLKIQNVTDEVKYLDSIGRQRNAEVVSRARVAEATARADSIVRSAENLERETRAHVDAQIQIKTAEAERTLREIRTRREALVAEEMATVNAAVARAKSDVAVQHARVEQVRRRLEADIVQPAKAGAEAAEEAAKADVAPILEDGRARADALISVAEKLAEAGPEGRELLLLQKLPAIISALTDVMAETRIEKVTMIDSGGDGAWATKALTANEQLKQMFGVDLAAKLQQWAGESKPSESSSKVGPQAVEETVISTGETTQELPSSIQPAKKIKFELPKKPGE